MCFFRVIIVVAFIAKTDKIVVIESQLRIFVVMLKMMYGRCFSLPSVPFAPLAHITVSAEYSRSLSFPCSACIKIFHKINLGCRDVGTIRRDLRMLHHED